MGHTKLEEFFIQILEMPPSNYILRTSQRCTTSVCESRKHSNAALPASPIYPCSLNRTGFFPEQYLNNTNFELGNSWRSQESESRGSRLPWGGGVAWRPKRHERDDESTKPVPETVIKEPPARGQLLGRSRATFHAALYEKTA